jgi:hypothetical protein
MFRDESSCSQMSSSGGPGAEERALGGEGGSVDSGENDGRSGNDSSDGAADDSESGSDGEWEDVGGDLDDDQLSLGAEEEWFDTPLHAPDLTVERARSVFATQMCCCCSCGGAWLRC